MLQHALRDDAARLPDGEGAALLRWFLDGNMTLLGYRREAADGATRDALGIPRADPMRRSGRATARAAAIAWFEAGHEAPLLLKADRIATRASPRAARPGGAAASARARRVTGALDPCRPVDQRRAAHPARTACRCCAAGCAALEEELGFDPAGHAGKALRHALYDAAARSPASRFRADALKQVALTAMSLADRPRPKLVLVDEMLGRHLFAFVWLPREELTTARREAIGRMIAEAAGGSVSSTGRSTSATATSR